MRCALRSILNYYDIARRFFIKQQSATNGPSPLFLKKGGEKTDKLLQTTKGITLNHAVAAPRAGDAGRV